ncbi:Sulfate transporter 1-2 [Nymphaea thermarum]|nr:Sulfate transporter 1-2 [Nymphaea thermarum]
MDHSQHDERDAEDSVTIKSATSGSIENDQMPLHRVGIPPRKHPLKELKRTIMEMFFAVADEPLRDFRDHPRSKKIILGMQAVFPILDWGRQYNYKKFVGNLVAGLTIASLDIPQTPALCLH